MQKVLKETCFFPFFTVFFPNTSLTFCLLWNSIPTIMISVKCMIAGLGRGWNPSQRLSLCAMLNDRAYINMKSIQLSLMELSGVILYPVISGPWANPQLLYLWDRFVSLCFRARLTLCISAWIIQSGKYFVKLQVQNYRWLHTICYFVSYNQSKHHNQASLYVVVWHFF